MHDTHELIRNNMAFSSQSMYISISRNQESRNKSHQDLVHISQNFSIYITKMIYVSLYCMIYYVHHASYTQIVHV